MNNTTVDNRNCTMPINKSKNTLSSVKENFKKIDPLYSKKLSLEIHNYGNLVKENQETAQVHREKMSEIRYEKDALLVSFSQVISKFKETKNLPLEIKKIVDNLMLENIDIDQFHIYERDSNIEISDISVHSLFDKDIIVPAINAGFAILFDEKLPIEAARNFGTASTGTPISSLSGAASDNASMAFLGGGSLETGGAGIKTICSAQSNEL